MSRSALALALAVTAASCAAPLRYEWGQYEESVHALTAGEGQVDVDLWIDSLQQTIERARSEDRPIPPGMHAHLAMLHSMRGNTDTAMAALESEKELYPESAVFVDGVIRRMRESGGGR